jgi:hypothetical protein
MIRSGGSVMAHPAGGSGSVLNTKHSFKEAYDFVGSKGATFQSTTGEKIVVNQGMARDGITRTIVFVGKTRHGSACSSCWGFRTDCNKSRIGQCAEALDATIR